MDLQSLVNLQLGALIGPPGFGDLNRDGLENVADVQTLANTVIGVSACTL